MVIYILTKFGADWLIFVDARALTRKLWTDGRQMDGRTHRTVSDHNSSLSTPCSGELKTSEDKKVLIISILLIFLCFQRALVNSLSNNKNLDWTKLKAFEDNKYSAAKICSCTDF